MTTQTAGMVSPREIGTLLKRGRRIDLIDVRTPAEYEAAHLEAARNVPLSDLDPVEAMADRVDEPHARIYLICQSGQRSQQAAAIFRRAGFANAVSVEGGMEACRHEGLPIKIGQPTISLERQVRIGAGTLVLVGTILGAWIDPAFLFIPGFVGAGLAFSGLTGTCGMAMVLARMPWNK